MLTSWKNLSYARKGFWIGLMIGIVLCVSVFLSITLGRRFCYLEFVDLREIPNNACIVYYPSFLLITYFNNAILRLLLPIDIGLINSFIFYSLEIFILVAFPSLFGLFIGKIIEKIKNKKLNIINK